MSPRSATQELRDEHRLILRAADCLEKLAGQPRLDVDAWTKCVTFLRGYADACHHGKEEGPLFDALEQAGLPRSDGLVSVFVEEHRVGRALVGGMQVDLGVAASDRAAHGRLRSGALAYVDLIRDHIAREDGVLFDVADSVLDAPACASICERYESVCAARFEGHDMEQLRHLLSELEAELGLGVTRY